MDRLLRVIRREDLPGGKFGLTLHRADGQPDPLPKHLVLTPTARETPLLMMDAPVFNAYGIEALPQGFWPVQNREGRWIAIIEGASLAGA